MTQNAAGFEPCGVFVWRACPGHLSFLTLQRGNAVLDALRPILNMQCGPNL
ncbi:DUF1534 domain-containing protein [Pseudomonas caricapapayae]|nr:DUF1534 domain-containing protein [Pseudomonas caricapapayae]